MLTREANTGCRLKPCFFDVEIFDVHGKNSALRCGITECGKIAFAKRTLPRDGLALHTPLAAVAIHLFARDGVAGQLVNELPTDCHD